MRRVLVDTSALYALADPNDARHEAALAFYKESGVPFLLSNLIFAETMSLLTKRVGKAAAVRFGHGLREGPRFLIQTLDAPLQEQAWRLFSARFKDKGFDLIDCACFAFMDSLKAREAFTFDAHFRQAGYQMVP